MLPIDGKADFETGFAGLGFKLDFSAVAVGDNPVADDEAQAGAGADGLGCCKTACNGKALEENH